MLASFTSGQLISRTGRYKVFPVLGSMLVLAGCVLLALLDADSSRIAVTLDLTVVGLGMGTMFQTFVIATQNRVEMPSSASPPPRSSSSARWAAASPSPASARS